MAIQKVLTDDLTGESEARTIFFSLDGERYRIDACESTLDGMREALRPYIEASKAVHTEKLRREVQEIRAWGMEQGYELSDRGRLPDYIRRAYLTTHGE